MVGDNLTVKTESSTGIIDFFFFPSHVKYLSEMDSQQKH